MEPCSATKCVSPARTVQGGLGLYEATTPCVSEHRHSSYDEKGEQTSMGLLQPFGIPPPHTKPPFPPFPKAQHAPRDFQLRRSATCHQHEDRRRPRVRAITATATSMHHYFDGARNRPSLTRKRVEKPYPLRDGTSRSAMSRVKL